VSNRPSCVGASPSFYLKRERDPFTQMLLYFFVSKQTIDNIGKFSNNNVIINVLIFCIAIHCIMLLSIKIQINTYWVKYNLKFYRSISPTCFGLY